MSKNKLYHTEESKNKNIIKVKINKTRKSRDLFHFNHQLNTRMNIVESKKFKPLKYPHKYEE